MQLRINMPNFYGKTKLPALGNVRKKKVSSNQPKHSGCKDILMRPKLAKLGNSKIRPKI